MELLGPSLAMQHRKYAKDAAFSVATVVRIVCQMVRGKLYLLFWPS